MNLREKLKSGKFIVTGEAAPQKGVDTNHIIEVCQHLRGHVDAINVTDNQRASVRLSSLAACVILAKHGEEPIFQMTCRDRNRIGLQSDLLGAWALGIENVLVVSGDHPYRGDSPHAKPVYDLDSIQAVGMVASLNSGTDLEGNSLHGATDFLIGAAANPMADDLEAEVARLEKKAEAGASFFQTQAVYDPERFIEFMDLVKPIGVKVLAGIVPLKSEKMARFINDNIPGIMVPDWMVDELAKTDDPSDTGIAQAAHVIDAVKESCDGVHIMAIGWESKVPAILERAGLK